MREVILNKLAAAYSKQKIRQAIRDIQNSIIMQQQDSQFADNYPGIEDKHLGREGIYPSVRKRLSMPYIS